MAGRWWLSREIKDKLLEREEVRQSEGIYAEAYKSLNEEVSWLTPEVRRLIWQLKVLVAERTSEMWRLPKSLTNNKPSNTCVVTDSSRACVGQRQKAIAFMNMYKSVSSLKLTKDYRGVKRTLNRTLRTLEATNDTWPGFTTSEVRAALSNLSPSKTACPDKVHPRLLRHMGSKALLFLLQLFNKSWMSTSIPQG